MKKLILSLALCTAMPAYAANTPSLLFDNNLVDMTYPDVAGDHVVYSQRLGKNHQIMRLNRHDLYGKAKDISATGGEVVRNGIALANGDIAYASNRLGHITPWLAEAHQTQLIQGGIFASGLQPNHLEASPDGSTWAFDSIFDVSHAARIKKQFGDRKLPHELLGQQWRMYHDRLWVKKSGYPDTKTGLKNTLSKPHLFIIRDGKVAMLGDGFDASLSADGSQVAFVREIDGNFDIWLQNTDGTGLKRLTRSPYADVEPCFSPDGKYIAFVSNRDSRGDVLQTFIHVLELATGKVQTVTSGLETIDGSPAWLDNHTLVFHSNRDPKSPMQGASDTWRLWTVSLQP